MPESARAFCQRCLRAFFDLADGEAPTDFHHSIKELVKKSDKCRACYESYRKTASLCRKTLARTAPADRQEALLGFLRAKTGRR